MRLLIELRHGARWLADSDADDEAHELAVVLEKSLGDVQVRSDRVMRVRRRASTGRRRLPEAILARAADMVSSRRHVPGLEEARVVSAEVDADDESALERLRASRHVVQVYANPPIVPTALCLGDPATGNADDVRRLLNVDELRRAGLTGSGVRLAVVDTGINLAHLGTRGANPPLAGRGHFVPLGVSSKPGAHAIGHGTMCAFDAALAAPDAALVDSASLLSTGPDLEAWLEDAIDAYDALLTGLEEQAWPSLVVSNSWSVRPGQGDLPPGDPGNYSHNPGHLFCEQIAALESAGADILFAAGNCGPVCDPDCCGFLGDPSIGGGSALAAVLTVGAADVTGAITGYSSKGPGAIESQKPDVLGYAHFSGSGVFPADNGTSAACPTVAGVVAAIRERHPAADLAPAQLRRIIRETAAQAAQGYREESGFGIIDASAILAALAT